MYTFQQRFYGPGDSDYRIYRTFAGIQKLTKNPETDVHYQKFLNESGEVEVIAYSPPTFEQEKAKKTSEVEAFLADKLKGPLTSSVERDSTPLVIPGGRNRLENFRLDLEVIQGEIDDGETPDTQLWDVYGEEHTLTVAEYEQIVKEIAKFGRDHSKTATRKKIQIAKSTTTEELEAISSTW